MVKGGGGKQAKILAIPVLPLINISIISYFLWPTYLFDPFWPHQYDILEIFLWKTFTTNFFILNRSRWISLDPFRYFISPLFCVNRIWVFSVSAGDTPWPPDTSWLIIFPQHWYLSNYHQPWKLITAFFVMFFLLKKCKLVLKIMRYH